LIQKEYTDKNLNDPIILRDLINSEFGTNYTESDIHDYLILKRYEDDMNFIESEDAILIHKHSYAT
jgi:hypothetical protein